MKYTVDRRTFMYSSLATVAGGKLAQAEEKGEKQCPIIDTHTHFYDPTRPQGVPWPAKDNALLYRPTLPKQYREMAQPLGVTGTIVVEASPWVEDNQWILDLAEKDTFLLGLVGNLPVGQPEFPALLKRFAGNSLFRGIRVRGADLAQALSEKTVLANFQLLADAGLAVDVLGGPAILSDTLKLAQHLPKLRIVIDHVPFDWPRNPRQQAAGEATLQSLGQQPAVFAKVSNVLRMVENRVPLEVDAYRKPLDQLWKWFGTDRVIYGSNWPVSQRVAPYADVQNIVQQYVSQLGAEPTAQYFWKNSQSAYGWTKRPG